jgi:hypothetical protein
MSRFVGTRNACGQLEAFNALEIIFLARLTLQNLPHLERLSPLYGNFLQQLEALEDDIRATGGNVVALASPPIRARTRKRCSCGC